MTNVGKAGSSTVPLQPRRHQLKPETGVEAVDEGKIKTQNVFFWMKSTRLQTAGRKLEAYLGRHQNANPQKSNGDDGRSFLVRQRVINLIIRSTDRI